MLNWKLTLLCVLTLPVLIGLGVWQLDRAEQKREHQARLDNLQSRPPARLPEQSPDQIQPLRRVVMEGEYRPGRNWLLDNRQRDGRVGYEVVSPFELTDGRLLLVNRGWVAGSADRRERPNPPVPEGPVTLFGQWRAPSDHPLLERAEHNDDWPRVVLELAPAVFARALEAPVVTEAYVRLESGSPGALVTDWPSPRMNSARHTGYAVQWFAMALAVVVWFVLANTRWGARLTRRRAD